MSKHDFRPTFEEPIRDEIFSAERLEQFATYLAREVKVTTSRHLGRSLLPQIKKNHEFLVEAYHDLIDAVEQGESIPPAGEWIIDNFHIVEEQIREIQQDLPESFYRELPKLNDGDLTDYPRVYAIALALLAHTDSRLEVETIKRFLAAFQTVSPLQIGELWAVAIHLRIALVENMRRIAAQVIHIELLKRQASKIVDHLLSADEISEREIQKHADEIHVLLERASPCECALLSLITQKMRDQDPKFLPIVEGLNRFCSFRNQKIDDAIREGHQQQSLTQATTRNIVQSMRLLSTIDWQAFFESVSQVDKILALDPASAYSKMDFESRNRYRDVIERISKRTGVDEISIAEVAIDLSVQAKKNTQDPNREHVGYFLVDRGLEILENRFRYRPTALERIRGFLKNHPYFAYFFPLLSLSIIGVFPFLFYARHYGAPVWIQITATGIALVPISDIALNIVNLFLSSLLPPRVLQKLDFSQGIPEGEKTIVVVPVIFQDAASVTKAIENLEIRFIANQDANLTFALLSDFPDAESETTDADPLILTALKEGIDRLNRHYTTEQPIFYSFYRRRLWSDSEGKWLGWERKRGKLHEFNRFLRGLDSSTFVATSKFDPFLFNIKYVITLDADTQLPRNTARKLVGTICHPLNTPQIDSKSGLVTQGYGVLQPRISISLESANRSFFSRIFSGHTGIDPYTTAVSDVYQDLFGEGIYTGKGLYVIDAFETSLASRVPESCLLSHDLFEGEHARTALLSDIELLDDYPSHYESFARRQHRWTRGDWQIIEWLFPRVRNAAGERTKNLLSLLSRWKIFDNLRRSLVAPLTWLWLILAWTILPGSSVLWTLAIFSLLMIPPYAHATSGLIFHPRGIPWTSNFWNVWGNFWTNAAQVFLVICFLPHQAYLQSDAVARTLYRQFISKKCLLEWTSAASADQRSGTTIISLGGFIWASPLLSLMTCVSVILFAPSSLLIAGPFLFLWFFFPITTQWISKPRIPRVENLSAGEKQEVLLLARRTWGFFETFV
ncbi:MAG: GH36-type glycosyl hydrolase domain-containing protein, partial [Bdellovibrionota bacterium]